MPQFSAWPNLRFVPRLTGPRSRLWTIALFAALGALLTLAMFGDGRPVPGKHGPHIHTPRFVPAAVTIPAPLPRNGWTVTADSQEASYPAVSVLDGNAYTIWHTKYSSGADPLPHALTIDMHARQRVAGLTYLPRPATSPNGRIGQYRVEVSDDGTSWNAPVATGTFADDATLKTVVFASVVTRFVRLTALTEAGNRGPWISAAELNLLSGTDPVLPRNGWSVSADSQETAAGNYSAANLLDGNTNTFWHTRFTGGSPPLPHRVTIDMRVTNLVSGLTYLSRQDGIRNGNIGWFRIETSIDGATWGVPVTTDAFADVSSAQLSSFPPALARYVRLTALTEAGNRGPWSNGAEINLLGWPDPTLSRGGWTVAADSQETAAGNYSAANALDGNSVTLWHTRYSDVNDPLPHTLTIDMHASKTLAGLTYLPRPGPANGRIGQYRIELSTNGSAWSTVANGTFPDNTALQTVSFPQAAARYVRLTALTEAGNRGPWSSAAEVNLLGPGGVVTASKGAWAAPVGFPLVPVAAALLPNGKVLTWSSYAPDTYGGSGKTVTATYDPATGVVTQRTVTDTGHDMFCPGIALLPDGRVLVAGGDDSGKTSIYDPATDGWTTGPQMVVPRGYQSDVTLSDGRVFTIGGSWSGGVGGKNGEVWSASDGWHSVPGALVDPILTNDAQGIFRADNHAWLFAWSGGRVLQAGPSKAMNWFNLTGSGSTSPAGSRGQDDDAMNGDAVMYDAGKILAVGGSPSYQYSTATANAHVITLNGGTATVHRVAPMAGARAFANSVVLPDGKVAVFGGQNYPVPFSDNTAVLSPELWDPETETFTTLTPAVIPRTYHSVALLLPDGRVFTSGGGLCGSGCSTNHFDGEIFTPPYLLNLDGTPASRPKITSAPSTAANGATITVATDRAVTGFSIVRFGSATHSLNTDQRRVALAPTAVSGGYDLTIPADPGVAVPGYYMLFALDSHGVPSVAKTIRIG